MRATILLPLLAFGCDVEEPLPIATPGTTPPTTTGPLVVEDTHVQSGYAASDVLVVADADLLDDVLSDLPLFIDYGVDQSWHLGVTSTGLGGTANEVGVVSWVDLAQEPNPAAVLGGVSPVSGPDGAMGAVEAALGTLDTTLNAGFRRGYPLHVVVLSASDDATPYGDPVAFTAWLQGLSSDVTFSARVPATATTYLDLATSLGGITSDIDTEPGAPFFDHLGLVATGITRTFPLSTVPAAGTLEVEVAPPATPGNEIVLTFEEGADFTWDAGDNTITFTEYVPEQGAEVRVRYEAVP